MILEQIVADNRKILEARKERLPLDEVKSLASNQPGPLDFAAALRGDGVSLIGEVKKASPSRGIIRRDFKPVEIAGIYAQNGASAISVLTEEKHFMGRLEYLSEIKKSIGYAIPLLRKDFIFDPYQIYESRAYGADAILLIVAMLDPKTLADFLNLAGQLGLASLVELHNEAELETALAGNARIIGINNRDLKTFKVDISTTMRLRPLIPPDRIVVSESGIKSRQDIARLRQRGVDAVLIGETLMASDDIAGKMKELL